MSGGIAYLLDAVTHNINKEMVDIEKLDSTDLDFLENILGQHLAETDSEVAKSLLENWPKQAGRITKVMPRDYRRVLDAQAKAKAEGRDPIEAIMEAARV
jgi:glutamate synthase (NADPH/NADH) large chain